MIKRLFDILVSLGGLISLSLVMFIVGLNVLRKLGLPMPFTLVRSSLNVKELSMMKFSTILDITDKQGNYVLIIGIGLNE